VEAFGSLKAIRSATVEELDEVEGIGDVRARAVREGLARLRDQVVRNLVM
jgi:diadenylate cyclase